MQHDTIDKITETVGPLKMEFKLTGPVGLVKQQLFTDVKKIFSSVRENPDQYGLELGDGHPNDGKTPAKSPRRSKKEAEKLAN